MAHIGTVSESTPRKGTKKTTISRRLSSAVTRPRHIRQLLELILERVQSPYRVSPLDPLDRARPVRQSRVVPPGCEARGATGERGQPSSGWARTQITKSGPSPGKRR
jgi:hypothetical protein